MAGDWTTTELATLALLAETFVRGDAVRRARLTAAALDVAADPAQLRQLRLVLRVMESRLANLLLARIPRGLTAMSPAERERYVLGWGHSRVGLRRTVFGALRRLLTFLAYADPGVEGPNPRHVAMGYEPDRPPVDTDDAILVPYRPPFEASRGNGQVTVDADVVIVGSGAGGGVVASMLAAAGRSVVVVESGPLVNEPTMPTNELDAFDRLYLDHGLLSTWDGAVTMLAGSVVGGGTLVNWMTTIPAPPTIRDEWCREHGLDDLADGDAWTDDVETLERELLVSPAVRIPPKDMAILRGAAALDWEAAPTARNAEGCTDCGSCGFGCRRGSKRSGLRVHLVRAVAEGARIMPNVRVTRVILEDGRATGVEAEATVFDQVTDEPVPDAESPGSGRTQPLRVHAPVVVLAAGGLRTPTILERSSVRHPSIGRHLRLHPAPLVAGRFATPIDMWHGTMQGARSLQFGTPDGRRQPYVIESAPGHPGLVALALPWEGNEAHARVMGDARYIAPLIAVTRDGGAGRVSTTSSGRVRVDYRLDGAGVTTLRHALVQMARLSRAAGANEIVAVGTPPAWFRPGPGPHRIGPAGDAAFERYLERLAAFDFSPGRGSVFSAHQMGTARMGAAPRDHPCDPWGRVRRGTRHDRVVGGLYVGDGSLFPTGLGINPMLTVMALARRVARTVLAETAGG